MPHHTFWWEGIDGSRVFTHFPPVDTYNSDLSARSWRTQNGSTGRTDAAARRWCCSDTATAAAGPTREMLAAAQRTADLEGSPTVRIDSAASFFSQAQAEYEPLPVWVGEMYLELHRGTYTSQARTKQGNRRSEHLLREAELWSATAAVRTGHRYPAAELKRLWRLVLLQQFHDILPGSSIAWVHQDAERNYAAVERGLEAIITNAAAAALGTGSREFLLNAAPHERLGVPALAAAEPVRPGQPVEVTEDGGGYILDNGIIRAVVDARGLLVSLTDRATGREAIAPGEVGNLLELHRDTPNEWDAWDIDAFYRRNVVRLDRGAFGDTGARPPGRKPGRRRGGGADGRVLRRDPADYARAGCRLARDHHGSWTGRRAKSCSSWALHWMSGPTGRRRRRSSGTCSAPPMSTRPGRPRNSKSAPTAGSTSPSRATGWRSPTLPATATTSPATSGSDDGGTTTTVRLSLLRAPKFPDPGADQGRHELHVTVRPGATIADAVEEGYRTNLAPRVVQGAHGVEPLVTVFNQALVIEAVKLAEDGSGDVIVRLYESLGERSTGAGEGQFPGPRAARRGSAGTARRRPGSDGGPRFRRADVAALPAGHAEVCALTGRAA